MVLVLAMVSVMMLARLRDRPDVLDAMRREDEAFERLEGVLGAMLTWAW